MAEAELRAHTEWEEQVERAQQPPVRFQAEAGAAMAAEETEQPVFRQPQEERAGRATWEPELEAAEARVRAGTAHRAVEVAEGVEPALAETAAPARNGIQHMGRGAAEVARLQELPTMEESAVCMAGAAGGPLISLPSRLHPAARASSS